jgi:hypothetical protein
VFAQAIPYAHQIKRWYFLLRGPAAPYGCILDTAIKGTGAKTFGTKGGATIAISVLS